MGKEYWRIAVEESLAEVGIEATSEQIDAIAEDMRTCQEMEYEASGRSQIPNPLQAEVDRQKSYRKDDERDYDRHRRDYEQRIEDLRRENDRLRWQSQGANF